MSPSSHRLLRLSGVAVAVVLLGLAFYPGTLATPYVTADDTPKYAHTIVPESSPVYEEYTEEYEPRVYQYDDLSPAGQEVFDRARAAEPRPQYSGERRYVPDVCRDFVLVCDEYSRDELPEQFTYGTELTYEESLAFVEDGDDRYLLQTGITGHLFFGPFPVRFVVAWLTMLPLAALVAVVTVRSGSDRALGGAVGGGALVAVLAVLTPYVEMVGLGSARTIRVALLTAVWLAIVAAGGYWLYRRTAGSERDSTPDES